MKGFHDSQGLAIRLTDAPVIDAHPYGLPEQHLVHSVETVHEGQNHDERLRATLARFREWKRRKA